MSPRCSTHIFADDTMVAHTDNVWRSLHHPVKHRDNPVLVADRDWEGYVVLQPMFSNATEESSLADSSWGMGIAAQLFYGLCVLLLLLEIDGS